MLGGLGARPVFLSPVPAAALLLAAAAHAEPPALRLDSARLAVEQGTFPSAPEAAGATLLRGELRASATDGDWEWVAGARFDGQEQAGAQGFAQQRLAPGENFVRRRGRDLRLTVGWQNLLWGRVHELPPGDRLARVDFTRFILDPLPERRRPVPALRLERFAGNLKIDAVAAAFEPALMPDARSVWYPIDTVHGRLLGIGSFPLIIGSRIRDTDPGGAGGGVRVTGTTGDFDYGLSLQRTRQSLPYYRGGLGQLTSVHPESWTATGEWEAEWHGATWRLEAAWNSDLPLTARRSLRYFTAPGVDAVAGVELHPGDGETRLDLQLAAHRNLTATAVLDRVETYSLDGELHRDFGHGLWRAQLRFIAGLNEADRYLNPRLDYTGFAPHTLYLAAHLFGGAPQTPGGFYAKDGLVAAGWEVRF